MRLICCIQQLCKVLCNFHETYNIACITDVNNCIVGNLGSYPGSLDRATGEKVTESEVSRVFRGTDNRQSDLGSWGPSVAREGRPKGDIISLTSEGIEGR